LFAPVEGYWVLLDRLIAWYASGFPLILVPFVYNLSANVLAATSIAYFCCRARDVFRPFASLSVLLLVPMVSGVMLDNITHLQWFSQLALVSACLLPRPPAARNSRIARVFELTFLTAAALTGPFAIFCSLVYLLLQTISVAAGLGRLTRIRARLQEYLHSLDGPALVVTVVAGAAILFLAHSEHKIVLPDAKKTISDFFLVVAGEGLQVHALGPVLFSRILFACFQVVLFGIIALVPMSARARMGCFALLLYGWLVLLAGFVKSQSHGFTALAFNYDDKYFFALAVFEWLVLWRIVGSLLRDRPVAPTLLVGSALVSATIAFPYWHVRSALPETNWAQYAKKIEAGEDLDVAIYPNWSFHVAGRQAIDGLHSGIANKSEDSSSLPGSFGSLHRRISAGSVPKCRLAFRFRTKWIAKDGGTMPV